MTRLDMNNLIAILRAHPGMSSADLCKRLGGINRSTLSRRLKALGDAVISRGGSRRTAYALRRELRGSGTPVPLYRIDESGRGHLIGELDCIQPAGTALLLHEPFGWPLSGAMQDGWFEGLPYPIGDARPQGFLGRSFARHHAMVMHVSENPDDWSDDDILHVTSTLGFDLPGDLILGDSAYRLFLARGAARAALTEQDIPAAYPAQASSAMAGGDAGYSAGGEFPKFTAYRDRDGIAVDVIVKFSGADNSAAVRRWSDLLVCEHLALQVIESELGIAAAQSRIYQFAGRTFLEVVRFDRHGVSGRSPVCTLGSMNAALLGMASSSWLKVSQKMLKEKRISVETARRIELLWWFGRLTGNSDMHEGNLAFRAGSGMELAPAYDMLPMMFAPAPGGEVPVREFNPVLPLPGERASWLHAAAAAVVFWRRCAEDGRIGDGFRKICGECADGVQGRMSQI